MWSVEYTARASVLTAQQRVLFPISSHSNTTSRQLTRALLSGVCSGVALLTPDDDNRACRLIHDAMQHACATNPLLPQTHFAVVVETGTHWMLEQLHEHVSRVLQHLQLPRLDLLLLRARTLALSERSSTYERKRIVLQFWDAMLVLQQRGLVAHIGISGFSTQLAEFIFTAHRPPHAPVAFALAVCVADEPSTALSVTSSTEVPAVNSHISESPNSATLTSAVAFAHARGMDVLVHFPLRCLESMPLTRREQWHRVTSAIALSHREQAFDSTTIHEADTAPFVVQTGSMRATHALQTPLQIAMRYLLQLGLVVVPTIAIESKSKSIEDGALDDDVAYELFYMLLHPFTALAPSVSATKLYSSLLSTSDMDTLALALPLHVHAIAAATAAATTDSPMTRT